MKFRIERDVIADAVAWTARALPARPPVPVLSGLLLDVDAESLTVSGFDYEVSTQVRLEVHADVAGKALVSGRLLAEITRSLPPHPVDFAIDGQRVAITCGNAKFSLPTMPIEDYPSLPAMPTTVGTIPGDLFATAVSQVAIAAGRDDTIPMLTGVRLEIDGEQLTMVATDRYRLAQRRLTWKPAETATDAAVLIPARTLLDAAKTLAGEDEVTISLAAPGGAGEGMIGLSAGNKQMTTRLLDAQFLPYQSLWPAEFTATAQVEAPIFVEAAKRVALLADRGTPVRLEFGAGSVTLTAGGDDEGRAEENVEVAYDGESVTMGFNSTFLLDGLSAIGAESVRFGFTSATKPAVMSASDIDGADPNAEYRYLTMPMRLPG